VTSLHPATWLIWTFCALVPALLTRNPYYLLALGGAILFVHWRLAPRTSERTRGWRTFFVLISSLTLLAVPLQALFVHRGTHVLFRIPLGVPLVGGPITMEAVLYGFSSASSVAVILLLFVTLNALVLPSTFLRLAPPFLREAGTVATLSLTFFPRMLANLREIREAQLARGHTFKRLRDALPLFSAVVTNGLEESIRVAEALECRGFGFSPGDRGRSSRLTRHGLILATAVLAIGLLWMQLTKAPGGSPALYFILTGSATLLLLLVLGSRHSRTTRYRSWTFRLRDGVLTATHVSCMGLFLLWSIEHPELLAYDPYRAATLHPPFSLVPLFAALFFSVPAWFRSTGSSG